jgi:hypothetical protein
LTSCTVSPGMSEAEIDEIIGLMRFERYRFAPARRACIPEKNGRLRPLGIPSWRDRLAGEVIGLILEAACEPSFSSRPHGSRQGRGCHTALRQVRDTRTGTAWFIEGDICDCYGSVGHEILMQILAICRPPAGPRRHRPLVGADVAVGQQVQALAEHLPAKLRERQALPAALAGDAQHRPGFPHCAYLTVSSCPSPVPLRPAARLSRASLAGRDPCDYHGHSAAPGLASGRRSRVHYRRPYLARLRRPVRLLQCPGTSAFALATPIPATRSYPSWQSPSSTSCAGTFRALA